MRSRITVCLGGLGVVCLVLAPVAVAQNGDIPRTPSGRPDLSGTYDVSTLPPMQRPEELGEAVALSAERAAEIAEGARRRDERRARPSDPERGAPPQGGRVGGYNGFYIDNGDAAFQVGGQWRTSILIDPPNGRYPPRVDDTPARGRTPNPGTAFWLEAGLDAPGPYDNMEQRPYGERCMVGFGSTGGPPMLPVLYNNHKRIVQTEDTVMILTEMVHDARIVRLDAEHDPPTIKKWLGDSIGWWEGDTLVVETTNFVDRPAFRRGTGNMTVTERFRMESAGTLIYTFTVDDPTVWTATFTGEYAWPRSGNKVFEYACHEANYALQGIMRGARLLEAEFRGEQPEGVTNPTR